MKLGKAKYIEPIKPLTNLPIKACHRLWEQFHDIAEGFGLQCDELQEICGVLGQALNLERDRLDAIGEQFFRVLDTDENGLVDALEAQVAVAGPVETVDAGQIRPPQCLKASISSQRR